MKAISATRKQSLIFLVPDEFVERDLSYNELLEELDKLAAESNNPAIVAGSFMVYASTDEADIDSVMTKRDLKNYIRPEDHAEIIAFINSRENGS